MESIKFDLPEKYKKQVALLKEKMPTMIKEAMESFPKKENVLNLMEERCKVVITRTAMSDRVGVIRHVTFMEGEMYIGLEGGGMYPLTSVEVTRK